ncbi:hypothetical protein GIY23_15225 [Allosaccharopolyspora coralli]|uniref:Integral membrane protein n=1 Tax=Allosaccharopolyspora coralli TaxID=2665642 RepID=A0A5Q3QBE3_9PSEU|nr:DUF6328 family protein [Allosaccharopolyspora coralli]QGK70686.1 hypothetical protein GIY23_15225 [Allosaccharopolyspora coralli]
MTGPEETHHTKLTRNLSELLQELRVAQAGVQILFAFLLTVAFTDRFARAGTFVHTLHIVTVLLTCTSATLLIAPAAWHRMLFRKRRRAEIIRAANSCALGGLALLAAAMTSTVLLVTVVVIGFGWLAPIIATCIGLSFLSLWFLLPWRIGSRRS